MIVHMPVNPELSAVHISLARPKLSLDFPSDLSVIGPSQKRNIADRKKLNKSAVKIPLIIRKHIRSVPGDRLTFNKIKMHGNKELLLYIGDLFHALF